MGFRRVKGVLTVTILISFAIFVIVELTRSRSQERKDLFLHKKSYNFTINNPRACHTAGRLHQGVFLLVIVVTQPQNFQQRSLFRQTWGSRTQYKDEQIRTLFLAGRSPNFSVQFALKAENDKYEDIIQADFEDCYLNLTLKMVLALRWTVRYCPNALYILKTDDDMIVRYDKLAEYLYNLPWKPMPRLYMGFLLVNKVPKRSKDHKWYTSYEEWPEEHFPTYISGPAYVMGRGAVKGLYSSALETPLFKFEDLFMGICARKANLTLSHNDEMPDRRMGDRYTYCLYDGFITIHHAAVNLSLRYWEELHSAQRPICNITGWEALRIERQKEREKERKEKKTPNPLGHYLKWFSMF
ncbi:beta-1,3-galactosyltransferase 5 [Lingula anatina]|uniref:Hexosyltransferase n=1 Tax=Lingula anatina TaxID=7574 RepID=A0A1S3HQQ3_LINAN|nr:beta-1,3-galactosyltransferase 5 [Lingula anatina]|eukprot:XP_013388367.1 beta-1,3-galactosyltransferase 5 [Lingula anatina]